MRKVALAAALVLMASGAQAVSIEWVTVGDPGNVADTEVMPWDGTTGYGSVAYSYRIAKYHVTNDQYVEFLNAAAPIDPYGLYNSGMSHAGITRIGGSGNYSYAVVAGSENRPVNYVSFYDNLRFANWMHNGQGGGDTETGAYTITAAGIAANSITRNSGATTFIPSEDEWYKAAYYDALSMTFYDYPAGTDSPTTCAAPGSTPNTANCGHAVGGVTDVGSYTGSASPYGTYDQGGNVYGWNEAIITNGQRRGLRGGWYTDPQVILAASYRGVYGPTIEGVWNGIRIASPIPEPSTALLLGLGLVGMAARRRA